MIVAYCSAEALNPEDLPSTPATKCRLCFWLRFLRLGYGLRLRFCPLLRLGLGPHLGAAVPLVGFFERNCKVLR